MLPRLVKTSQTRALLHLLEGRLKKELYELYNIKSSAYQFQLASKEEQHVNVISSHTYALILILLLQR